MQVKWDENRGHDFWRPMYRNELLNSTDIEIVRQYNSEIRGLYNFYRIAENVGVLSKFYCMMRYSMLKTYAGKYRTNVSKIKKKYMRGGVFRVPYDTKSGPKLCEFYHDGFRKHDEGYDNVQNTLPRYIRYDGRNTLANRLKAGICALCGNKMDDISALPVQLSFINRRSQSTSRYEVNIPAQADDFGSIRGEFVGMLKRQIARSNNGIERSKYITFGVPAGGIAEARTSTR